MLGFDAQATIVVPRASRYPVVELQEDIRYAEPALLSMIAVPLGAQRHDDNDGDL